MAIDPKTAPAMSDPGPTSIIENEIPTYRAISSAAVFSLMLGVASIFCFTNLVFLVVVVGAILVGVLSLRTIERKKDVLTGASFAKVGITLALVCGIAASTSSLVQSMMMNREASQFASNYVEVIKAQPVATALWYLQPPAYRKTKKPDEIVDEMKKSSGQNPAGDTYTTQSAPVLKIKDILKEKGAELHFEKVESSAFQGLTSYANALLEIHNPAGKDPADKEQFARLRLRKDSTSARGEWTVEELEFPYKPASYVEKVAAPDDGHGHGGGGH